MRFIHTEGTQHFEVLGRLPKDTQPGVVVRAGTLLNPKPRLSVPRAAESCCAFHLPCVLPLTLPLRAMASIAYEGSVTYQRSHLTLL